MTATASFSRRAQVWVLPIALLLAMCTAQAGCSKKPAASPADAGPDCNPEPGQVAEACGCDYSCVEGAQCIQTLGRGSQEITVCTSVDSGTCYCGIYTDVRCENGARCFCPFTEARGICLMREQRDKLCSSSLGQYFTCQPWHEAGDPSYVDDAGNVLIP